MIAKHVPMRSLGKSDFAGLVNYVTDAQNKDHRLGQVQITNCDAVSVRDAITEILATQHMNTRAKGDKSYHLIVSFRAGENPDADILKAIEERICQGLGFGEHQRISAVHNCRIPDDWISPNRQPLFLARAVMAQLMLSLNSSGSL